MDRRMRSTVRSPFARGARAPAAPSLAPKPRALKEPKRRADDACRYGTRRAASCRFCGPSVGAGRAGARADALELAQPWPTLPGTPPRIERLEQRGASTPPWPASPSSPARWTRCSPSPAPRSGWASTPFSASSRSRATCISQAISTYIIWEAHQLGRRASSRSMRMFGNTLIDTVIGSVPMAGDAFDVAFRANMKNLRLLQRHLEKRAIGPSARRVIGRLALERLSRRPPPCVIPSRTTNERNGARLKRRGWRRAARSPG